MLNLLEHMLEAFLKHVGFEDNLRGFLVLDKMRWASFTGLPLHKKKENKEIKQDKSNWSTTTQQKKMKMCSTDCLATLANADAEAWHWIPSFLTSSRIIQGTAEVLKAKTQQQFKRNFEKFCYVWSNGYRIGHLKVGRHVKTFIIPIICSSISNQE